MVVPHIEICRADELIEKVGQNHFDLVISIQDNGVFYPQDDGAAPILAHIYPGQDW